MSMEHRRTSTSTNRNFTIVTSALLIGCMVFLSFLSISYQSDNASLESLIESKKRPTHKLFQNLLRHTPRLVISGDYLAIVGDTLTFSVLLDENGCYEHTEQCEAKVFRDGTELSTIPCTLVGSEVLKHGIGLQHFTFEYSPTSDGLYEIWVQAGTNGILLSPTTENRPDSILILGIPIPRSDIRTSLDRILEHPYSAPYPFVHPSPSHSMIPVKFLLEVVTP